MAAGAFLFVQKSTVYEFAVASIIYLNATIQVFLSIDRNGIKLMVCHELASHMVCREWFFFFTHVRLF